jgi:ParB-like nuclease domain
MATKRTKAPTPARRRVTEADLREMARLLAKGLGAEAIGKRLRLSKSTVQRYLERLKATAAATGHPAVEVHDVPLDQFTLTDTQARVRLDPAVVEEYAEAMTEGVRFPPVVLFWEGDLYWVGDGHHRIAAARRVGFTTIKAEVRPGAEREALLYACGANISHGLRRTNADKRKVVETLLRDEEWRRWSDREIARHCGVTHPFVQKLRQELAGLLSGNGYQMDETRTVRRGETVYTMDTSRIGTLPEAPADMVPYQITIVEPPPPVGKVTYRGLDIGTRPEVPLASEATVPAPGATEDLLAPHAPSLTEDLLALEHTWEELVSFWTAEAQRTAIRDALLRLADRTLTATAENAPAEPDGES